MRVYLVIIDETPEAELALRFAAARAARTGGALHLLALVPVPPFSAFGAVHDTIAAEARSHAEELVAVAAKTVLGEGGGAPQTAVREGDGASVVRDYLTEHPEVSALVLGAAASGGPGPLVSHFTSAAGQLPCPVYVIPGGLDAAGIERIA